MLLLLYFEHDLFLSEFDWTKSTIRPYLPPLRDNHQGPSRDNMGCSTPSESPGSTLRS